MINQIVSNITPIIISAAFAVITVVIKGIADVVTEYIKTKKEQIIAKIGADNYDNYRLIAYDVYFRVEQEFKGKTNVAQEKLLAFDKYLLAKIPGLTEDDLNHFRESTVGLVNNAIEEKGLLDKATAIANGSNSTDTKDTTVNQNTNDVSQIVSTTTNEGTASVAAATSIGS